MHDLYYVFDLVLCDLSLEECGGFLLADQALEQWTFVHRV